MISNLSVRSQQTKGVWSLERHSFPFEGRVRRRLYVTNRESTKQLEFVSVIFRLILIGKRTRETYIVHVVPRVPTRQIIVLGCFNLSRGRSKLPSVPLCKLYRFNKRSVQFVSCRVLASDRFTSITHQLRVNRLN